MSTKHIHKAIDLYKSRGPLTTVLKLLYFIYYRMPAKTRIKMLSKKCEAKGNRIVNDPAKVTWVPPNKIQYFISDKKLCRDLPRYGIIGGKWDERAYPFEENDIYNMFVSHFQDGLEWEETKGYQRLCTKLNENGTIGGLDTSVQSTEILDEYLSYWDTVYEDIKEEGYRSQEELSSSDDFIDRDTSILNEIQVLIGRDGDLICYCGKHRLTLAQILDIEEVPVYVRIRHREWQDKLERRGIDEKRQEVELLIKDTNRVRRQ